MNYAQSQLCCHTLLSEATPPGLFFGGTILNHCQSQHLLSTFVRPFSQPIFLLTCIQDTASELVQQQQQLQQALPIPPFRPWAGSRALPIFCMLGLNRLTLPTYLPQWHTVQFDKIVFPLILYMLFALHVRH